MLDPLLTPAAFLHAFALLGLLVYALKRSAIPWRDMPFIALLLLWGALVLGAHGASLLKSLGSLFIYVPATFLGLGIMLAIFDVVRKIPAASPLVPAPRLEFPLPESEKTRKNLFWFLAITLGLFAAAVFVVGQGVYPDNADSMIYRLPRAVWYVSHGSFLHPFDTPDNRLIYYPMDGVALYIPLILYGLPGTYHALPSFIVWAVIVYASYRFARSLGAERLLSLFAAWLVGMTPSILAQANSTNDEIITAAAFLVCLYMGWRWLLSGRHYYFFLSGLALGLCVGTKLHIVFLMPMIGLAVLYALWPLRAVPARLALWSRAIGGKTFWITVIMIAVMFAPFLFYNYASTGRFYFFNDFKNDVFNLSASLRVGLQNLLIYGSQMVLSPIADLNIWPVANDRQGFNSALNALFNPLVRPWLSNDPAHYHLGYRFVGITIPVSVRFVEFSLWSAFIWLLWPLQGFLAWRQKFSLRVIFFLLAMTPPLWLLLWSFSTLYMEGTATYFTFYLVCAAPAAVMLFAPIARRHWHEMRWVLITFVTVTNLVICHNLVMYSGFRALPDLFYAKRLPYDWLLTENRIIEEIRAADRLRIVFTHEKMPYFGYMHWNPSAMYYSPFEIKPPYTIPDPDNVLQILPISSLNMYGFMPVKVPGKLNPGATYLGVVRAIGREAIFAVGRGVEKRHPDDSNYIILQAKVHQTGPDTLTLNVGSNPVGFAPDDQLTFAYELMMEGKVIATREAMKSPAWEYTLPPEAGYKKLSIKTTVYSAWSGKQLTHVVYPFGGEGEWLPEGPEY